MKKKKRIDFVSLESRKFLLDPDFRVMTLEQRGMYCTLIFEIYEKQGYINFDEKLYNLCNCNKKQFERVWSNIKTKFFQKRTKISHRKCIKELKIAAERSQILTDASLKANCVRWHGKKENLQTESVRNPNENVNVNEIENVNDNNSNSKRKNDLPLPDVYANYKRHESNSISTNSLTRSSNSIRSCAEGETPSFRLSSKRGHPDVSGRDTNCDTTRDTASKDKITVMETPVKNRIASIEIARLNFLERLNKTLRANSRSDRTGFNNICDYLAEGCRSGKFTIEIFDRALDLAKESRKGQNPNALFMSLARKELGYKKHPPEDKKKNIITQTIENFGKI